MSRIDPPGKDVCWPPVRSDRSAEVERMETCVLRRRWRGAAVAAVGVLFAAAPARAQTPTDGFRFPAVPAAHAHARELLANALRYLDPANKLSDAASGYP